MLRRAVFGVRHGRLAHRPAARQLLGHRVGHVPALAAEVGLVHFDRTGEAETFLAQCGPDAMAEMPGRVPRDVGVSVQLHQRDRLQAGHEQIDGLGPHLVAQVGVLHDGSAAHREALVRLCLAPAQQRLAGQEPGGCASPLVLGINAPWMLRRRRRRRGSPAPAAQAAWPCTPPSAAARKDARRSPARLRCGQRPRRPPQA